MCCSIYEHYPLVFAPPLIHRSHDTRDDKKARLEMRERISKLSSRYEREMMRKIGLGRINKLYEHWY